MPKQTQTEPEDETPKVPRTVSISARQHWLLRGWNASEYVSRLLEHYPPPPKPATLDELATLVRQRHPWACLPGGLGRSLARLDLPSYSSDQPLDSEAVSWDRHRIMTRTGVVRPRGEA